MKSAFLDNTTYSSKSDLLNWLSSVLDLRVTSVEQLANGAVYCQLMDAYFKDAVHIQKVNFHARDAYESLSNYKILQSALSKQDITKEIDVDKLSRASMVEHLDLLQWLHKYVARGGMVPADYDPLPRRAASIKGGCGRTLPSSKSNAEMRNSLGQLADSPGSTSGRSSRPPSPRATDHGTPSSSRPCSAGNSRKYFGNVSSRWRDSIIQVEAPRSRSSGGMAGVSSIKIRHPVNSSTQTDFVEVEDSNLQDLDVSVSVGTEVAFVAKEARGVNTDLDDNSCNTDTQTSRYNRSTSAPLTTQSVIEASGRLSDGGVHVQRQQFGRSTSDASSQADNVSTACYTPSRNNSQTHRSILASLEDADNLQHQALPYGSYGSSRTNSGTQRDNHTTYEDIQTDSNLESCTGTSTANESVQTEMGIAHRRSDSFAQTDPADLSTGSVQVCDAASNYDEDTPSAIAAASAPSTQLPANVTSRSSELQSPLVDSPSRLLSDRVLSADTQTETDRLPVTEVAVMAAIEGSPAGRLVAVQGLPSPTTSRGSELGSEPTTPGDVGVTSRAASQLLPPDAAALLASTSLHTRKIVGSCPELIAQALESASSALTVLMRTIANLQLLLKLPELPELDPYRCAGKLQSTEDGVKTLVRHTSLLLIDIVLFTAQQEDRHLATFHQRAMQLQQDLSSHQQESQDIFPQLQQKAPTLQSISETAWQPLKDNHRKLCSSQALDAALKTVGLAHFALLQGMHKEVAKLTSTFLQESASNAANASAVSPEKARSRPRAFKLGDYQLKQLRNGDVYKGRYVSSKKNGHGVYEFLNLDIYEGEFKDDRMDGHGVYTFSHEGRYEGRWSNAVYSVAGTETFAKGSTYTGAYQGGLRTGWGVCRFYNGDYYEGQWARGLRDGRGMQQCTDESNFVGEYVRGKRHGAGVYSFPNGDWYLGQYQEDLPHGYGVYCFASGQLYEGQWQHGKKHGWSLYSVDARGQQYVGRWQEGKALWVLPLAPGVPAAGHLAPPELSEEELEAARQQARDAKDKAQQAAAHARQLAAAHWDPSGQIQSSVSSAVFRALESASLAQAAREHARELATRLDVAVSLLQQSGTREVQAAHPYVTELSPSTNNS